MDYVIFNVRVADTSIKSEAWLKEYYLAKLRSCRMKACRTIFGLIKMNELRNAPKKTDILKDVNDLLVFI